MPKGSLEALAKNQFGFWQARHLLNRAGLGGTPDEIQALAAKGLDDAVESLLDFEVTGRSAVSADLFDPSILSPPTQEEIRILAVARERNDQATIDAYQRDRMMRQNRDREQMREIQAWWCERLITTPAPLEEKLTLFWHGHFASSFRAVEDSFHMFRQNQLLRAHAAGNVRQLLHGIIEDPAMLRFLNNNQNRRGSPNENLARELMELFTLGEGNGYGEQDIKEGARALTGYTFTDDSFRFDAQAHDATEKRIFGRVGAWNGHDFVDLILGQRFASEYLTLKVYKFFVNDLPAGPSGDAAVFLKKLSTQFRGDAFEMRPLLRTLFRSEHFYAPVNASAQIRSPVQLIVQTIRSLRTPKRSVRTLLAACEAMGQSLFYPPTVKGWDGGRSWINTATMFLRQNVALYLLTGRRPASYDWEAEMTPYDAMPLIAHLRGEAGSVAPDDLIDYLLQFTLGQPLRVERRATLRAVLAGCGDQVTNEVLIALLALITAMPEYQLC